MRFKFLTSKLDELSRSQNATLNKGTGRGNNIQYGIEIGKYRIGKNT